MTFSKWEIQKGQDYIAKKKPDFLSVEELAFIEKYVLWLEETSDWQSDEQTPGMFKFYKHPLMMDLQFLLQKEIEKPTGLNLLPTYNYFRIYRNGSVLEPHKDRPACEVSATMLIGKNYSPSWALHVGDSQGEVGSASSPYSPIPKTAGETHQAIVQEVGDFTIYRGCELNHWRETWETDADNYHIQLFVHYVDADGPYWVFENDDYKLGTGFSL